MLRFLDPIARRIRARLHRRLIIRSGLFDTAWYQLQYADVTVGHLDPALHYLTHGSREGRDPSPYFSTKWYLTTYPDVNASHGNPLVHYLRHGAVEGRLPKPPTQSAVRQDLKPDSEIKSTLISELSARAKKIASATAAMVDPPLLRTSNYLKTFIDYPPQSGLAPAGLANCQRLNVTWVIPDFSPGAGGHMTIFRIARHLEQFGHNVSFIVQNPRQHNSPDAALDTINQHFQPFHGSLQFLSGRDVPNVTGDALIATDRFTCYPVQAMCGFRRKFYFVQDYETLFYPAGTESLLTENTYRMGFDCLCAGEWLAKKMTDEYGLWARAWPLAYDPSSYFVASHDEREAARIAFYARHVTPRRAVELGMMAFDILLQRNIRFHVDFFGWDIGLLRVPYSHQNHGVLNPKQLGELYRQATIGLVFSATNHSLVNKEMMACGLPVLDFATDNVTSEFPPGTYIGVPPNPTEIADSIESALESSALRTSITNTALMFLGQVSWERSARIIEQAIVERIAEHQ